MASDERSKHFEFIQNIITRLNSNSFVIKGWAITLTSALLALAATLKNPSILVITGLPVIAFWILDTIYLKNERMFRCFYNEAVKENSSIKLYEIDLNKDFIKNDINNTFFRVFKSWTILPFYVSLLILTIVCICYLGFNKPEKSVPAQINISLKDTLNLKGIDKNYKPIEYKDLREVKIEDSTKIEHNYRGKHNR